jgi:hypothetical protein
MASAVASLAGLVANEHREWDDPLVCRAVFDTVDPTAIADAIDELCRTELGSGVAGARFYRVSVGCVAGVDLHDGRAVVIKAQVSRRPATTFGALFAVRRHLALSGFPCPAPIGEPVERRGRWITFEELVERGKAADAHDPRIRKQLATSLARMVALSRSLVGNTRLGGAWFTSVPDERTWPRPHSPLFDFEATAEGADWIDELAVRARQLRSRASGEHVIGHFDWRVEHARFGSDGEIVATYDWDSLHEERETVMVGANAHAFTADWGRSDIVRVPRVAEMAAFVDEYEAARGKQFTRAERETIAASCVYSIAYTARCNHAIDPKAEAWNGDFRPLLHAEADALLAGDWI